MAIKRRGFLGALGAGIIGATLGRLAPAGGWTFPTAERGWGTVTHVLGPGKRRRAVRYDNVLDEYAGKMTSDEAARAVAQYGR